MQEIFHYDKEITGVKGLVYLGDKILVYRRDNHTDEEPLKIDLPGGGIKGNETPFEVFKRELFEEFGLTVNKENMVYAKQYAGTRDPSTRVYFVVAKLPAEAERDIMFGDEGLEYMVISVADYLARTDAWKMFQERAAEYLATVKTT